MRAAVMASRHERWRYDSRYINAEVLRRRQIGTVLGDMGLHDIQGAIPRPTSWHTGPQLTVSQRRLHGLLDLTCVLLIRSHPDRYELTYVDRWTGAWADPTAGMTGLELVSLGAWRWVETDYSAARRIARIIRLPRLYPDDGGVGA